MHIILCIFAYKQGYKMIIKHISVLNYKNLAEVEIDLSPKLNCFLGENGMGKTNILDAIYYLSFCKSANNSVDSQNIRHDEDYFVIQGLYDTPDKSTEEVYCGLKRRKKKVFKRNKKEYTRLSDHIGLIPLVMVSPDDSLLIQGGSDERRRFMDVVISQYDKEYLNALIQYNKAMTQRNSLLKSDTPTDPQLYDVLEEMMAEYGLQVFNKRKEFISQFIPMFQEYYSIISQDKESVSLEYKSDLFDGGLLDILKQNRHKDLIMGYSLKGIHKDDLIMSLGEFPIKKEGSQGQNKTYLVALKLAQFSFLRKVSNKIPLLLLDDIFDKLDALRVEKIMHLVASPEFGQIFITDTNRSHLESILHKINSSFKLYIVANGTINLLEEENHEEEK